MNTITNEQLTDLCNKAWTGEPTRLQEILHEVEFNEGGLVGFEGDEIWVSGDNGRVQLTAEILIEAFNDIEKLSKAPLTHGQRRMVDINKGKQVKVNLIGDEFELHIQDGTIFQGQFRYVMSKAKKPRKPFIHNDRYVHANLDAHYYIVDPINIIL